jgi:predicted lipid-binding transport protein (Tim44 family)
MPQRTGWGAGLMGGLGGLLLGGFIGSMLFGGHEFGGVGLLELLVLGALAYFAFSFLRRRREGAPVVDSIRLGAKDWAGSRHQKGRWHRLDRVERSRAGDRTHSANGRCDPRMTAAAATSSSAQAAWMARDMSAACDSRRPRCADAGSMRRSAAQRRINRLENIAVRSTEVIEARQERGQDQTVVFRRTCSTTPPTRPGSRGQRTEPVKFEEFWTFVRPVGPGAWRLTAIQQP